MEYQVVKEYGGKKIVIAKSKDYDLMFQRACGEARDNSNSEFYSEIPIAIEERGYYMCGWSSTKIILEEVGGK